MRKCILSLFAVISLYSCSNSYYMLNTPHIPTVHKKGEVELKVTGETGFTLNGNQLQAAYGLTDKVVLTTGYYGYYGSDDDPLERSKDRGHQFEIGSGYLFHANGRAHSGIFANIGMVNYRGEYINSLSYSKLRALKTGFNFNFMSFNSRILDFGIYTGIQHLHYYNIDYNIATESENIFNDDKQILDHLSDHPNLLYAQSGIILGIGHEPFKFHFMFNYQTLMNHGHNHDGFNFFNQNPYTIGLGISINIDTKLLKEQ